MLVVQSKIYASAAEFRSIDMGLNINQLNLNHVGENGEKRVLIKLKAARNKFGVKSVHVSIVKPED